MIPEKHTIPNVTDGFFDTLFKSLVDAVIFIDEGGKVVLWNNSAESTFGYSANEILGSSIEKIIPVRFLDQHRNGMNNYMKGSDGKVIGKTVELVARTKDEREIPIELSLSVFKIPKGATFFCGIVRDISDRKKSEKELLDSLQRNELLLEEVNHRVRNNLQLLNGLLTVGMDSAQSENYENVAQQFKERIRTIAKVHTALYQTKNLLGMDLFHYVETAFDGLKNKLPGNIKCEFNIGADNLIIRHQISTAIGLILGEILNSLFCTIESMSGDKHKITYKALNFDFKGRYMVVIEHISENNSSNKYFDIDLVRGLAEQIDGNFDLVEGQNKITYKLTFKN